jgi:hypothetical protein
MIRVPAQGERAEDDLDGKAAVVQPEKQAGQEAGSHQVAQLRRQPHAAIQPLWVVAVKVNEPKNPGIQALSGRPHQRHGDQREEANQGNQGPLGTQRREQSRPCPAR